MAVNQSRSMSAELAEGATDGAYRKIAPERSNAESTFYEAKKNLPDAFYGIHEKRLKALPDGTVRATPGYVENPAYTPTSIQM